MSSQPPLPPVDAGMHAITIDDDAPVFEQLHPNARWGMRLGMLLSFGVVYVPIAAIFLIAWDSASLGVLARIVLFFIGIAGVLVLAWLYANARWRRASFALTDDGLQIRRGVFWRSETLVPRSRVQHTDLNRGPIDRHFGIATLKVFTAGTKLASVSIDGLPDARAIELRDALVSGDDDAV